MRTMVIAGGGLALIVLWLLFGSTGVFAWGDYSRALQVKEAQLEQLKEEQARLSNRRALLDPRHVDPDLVDELLRSDLNLIHPDDIVIPLNPPPAR